MRTHILLCHNYPYCLNATFHSQADCDRNCHSESNRNPTYCTACQENDDPDAQATGIGAAPVTSVDIEDGADQDDAEDDEATGGTNAISPEEQQEQRQTPRLRGGDGDGEDEGYNDSLSSPGDDYTYSDGDTSVAEHVEEEHCSHCMAGSRAAFEAHVRDVCNLLVRHGWTEFADVQAADVVADIRRRWERNREIMLREREERRERRTQRMLRREMEERARQAEPEREFEEHGEYEYYGERGEDDDEAGEEWEEDDVDDGEVMIFVLDDEHDEDADLEEGRRRGMGGLRGGGNSTSE